MSLRYIKTKFNSLRHPPEEHHLPKVKANNYDELSEFSAGGFSRIVFTKPKSKGKGGDEKERHYVAKICSVEKHITQSTGPRHNQPQTLERIEKEVAFLHLLHESPCVVQIVEAFHLKNKIQDEVWIVMEPMPCDLDDVKDAGASKPKDICYIACGMLKALEYLESQHIVHKDLKPPNVLLNRKGQVKLCDFGLSEKMDEAKGFLTVKQIEGSENTMPPELFEPGMVYDYSADIWSLGVTLLQVFEPNSLILARGQLEKLMWLAYRQTEAEYYADMIGPAAVDYEACAEYVKQVYKDAKPDPFILQDSKKYSNIYEFIKMCMLPTARHIDYMLKNKDLPARSSLPSRASLRDLWKTKLMAKALEDPHAGSLAIREIVKIVETHEML